MSDIADTLLHIPRFPHRFIGELQGIIPVEISTVFLCRNSVEIMKSFFIRIFPLPFSIVSLRIFPHEYFPHTSLKISKRNTRTQEGFQLCNKHHSVDLMSFFGELKCFQVWGNFHLISISPEFPCGFPFHF